MFISAVLMLIPGVGEILDAAGGITAVFDLLTAVFGVRSPRGFANAAEKRRGLQDMDTGAVPVIKDRMQVIDDLRNVCRQT